MGAFQNRLFRRPESSFEEFFHRRVSLFPVLVVNTMTGVFDSEIGDIPGAGFLECFHERIPVFDDHGFVGGAVNE